MMTLESRGFPESVTTTVIWATREAENSERALTEVAQKLESGVTAREMVQFVQPMLEK